MNQPQTPNPDGDETGCSATGAVDGDCATAEPESDARTTESPEEAKTELDLRIDDDEAAIAVGSDEPPEPRPRRKRHLVAYVVLPLLLMCMAGGAGYLKYRDISVRDSQAAALSSVQAATDGTIALLSYSPETAETTLTAARDRLTGSFRDAYTSLTNDVVIPGAKQKQISATATVPAASSVTADERHSVVLVFVDQSVTVGNDAPSATASAVQVTLDKADGRWLISGFDPK